jgi:hypothetical protein
MEKWQLWGGLALVIAFIFYCRSVTFQTEKIEDSRRRGVLRIVFLGIPFLVLIVLVIVFRDPVMFFLRNNIP